MVRILHTGDVHLGRKFTGFGEFGRKLRQRVRQTLTEILRGAPREVQLVLIAGDLFDSNPADPSEVRHFLRIVREVAPLPVCVLPGTHDRLSQDSVYWRPEFFDALSLKNLFVFRNDGAQSFYFPEIRVAVHGRANLVNRGGEPPLKDVRPMPDARWNVAIAHASIPLLQFGAEDEHDYYVRLEDAEASGMNYIALAHWHRFSECFPGSKVRVFYSGSPESVDFKSNGERGGWVRVQLDPSAVSAEKVPSGQLIWRQVELDLSGQAADEAVRHRLEGMASESTVLRLIVSGRPAPHFRLDPDKLIEDFVDRFAWLQIRDDTARDVPLKELSGCFARNTIGDFLCRAAQQKLEAAGADQAHWREILRRGSALLLGKEEV